MEKITNNNLSGIQQILKLFLKYLMVAVAAIPSGILGYELFQIGVDKQYAILISIVLCFVVSFFLFKYINWRLYSHNNISEDETESELRYGRNSYPRYAEYSKYSNLGFSFTDRFIEVCGTDRPAEIARLLNISYQAAKNYLTGTVPNVKVLTTISEVTPYSINWLLTGEGEKLNKESLVEDNLIVSDQMRAFIRQTCLEVISEVLSSSEHSTETKTIVLSSEQIKKPKLKTEKILNKSITLSDKD